MTNPYMTPQKTKKAPIIFRLPIFDFNDAHHLEQELQEYECCIARIKNPRPAGFIYDVALVYKDDIGKVYSLQMMQHHGELKDTPENQEIINGNKETGQTGQNNSSVKVDETS